MVYGCSTHWGVGRQGGRFFLGEEEAGGRNTGVVIRKQSAWVSLLRTTTKCRMAAKGLASRNSGHALVHSRALSVYDGPAVPGSNQIASKIRPGQKNRFGCAIMRKSRTFGQPLVERLSNPGHDRLWLAEEGGGGGSSSVTFAKRQRVRPPAWERITLRRPRWRKIWCFKAPVDRLAIVILLLVRLEPLAFREQRRFGRGERWSIRRNRTRPDYLDPPWSLSSALRWNHQRHTEERRRMGSRSGRSVRRPFSAHGSLAGFLFPAGASVGGSLFFAPCLLGRGSGPRFRAALG